MAQGILLHMLWLISQADQRVLENGHVCPSQGCSPAWRFTWQTTFRLSVPNLTKLQLRIILKISDTVPAYMFFCVRHSQGQEANVHTGAHKKLYNAVFRRNISPPFSGRYITQARNQLEGGTKQSPSTIKIEALCYSEMSVDSNGLHGVKLQKTELSISTAVRTASATGAYSTALA
jgi:hypothetical protein